MHFSSYPALGLILPLACVATLYEAIEDIPASTLSSFDFVIVGAGAGGSVLANRLSDNPGTSVLLIEAGPSNIGVIDSIIPMLPQGLAPNTAYDWNYTTTPQPADGVTDTMAYTRASSEEWDRYAKLTGDEGWSWNNMQNKTGITSVSLPGYPHPFDSRIIATTKELSEDWPFNLDMNSGYMLGIDDQWPSRSSGATSYLGPSSWQEELACVVNAQVTRIIQTGTDSGKPAFRSVEYAVTQSKTGPRTVVSAKKEVILAAGAIGTAQILLLSGIGPKAELSALGIKTILNNPAVGQNLTDHPLLSNMFYVNSNDTFDTITMNGTLIAEDIEVWNKTQQGPLVDSPLAHLGWARVPGATPDTTAGPNTPHYEILFAVRISIVHESQTHPTNIEWFPQHYDPLPSSGHFMTIVTAITAPAALGRHRSTEDRASNSFKGYVIREFEDLAAATDAASLKAYIQAKSATIFHPVGTAAMSPKGASWGVTDPDGVVKGLSGLRIIDASILPVIPSAHPQAVIYFFGERGAALVKEAYGLN
ncbi:hypothetical protein B0H12DRAFT_1076059 [Mycena haematopus]|nr:hypothetical protein B0H12DRAFT_1076059 [Mycena haematopus]